MLVGFVGDLHGRVFHALAAVVTWQRQIGRRFDLLIQVGDLGAFPELDQADPSTDPYLALDPAEADFSRLLRAEGQRARALRRLRTELPGPVLFIRGNHEDFTWLRRLSIDAVTATGPADPFDLFRYVPDGTVLRHDGRSIAFLGGVEEQSDDAAIDADAYQSLLNLGSGQVDVLVTHEGPYGTSIGYHGDVHGSPLISRLIDELQPAFHVAGHAHCLHGPRAFGRTTYMGIDGLVASPRWYPAARGLQTGCLATLDTATGTLRPVTDPWLADFPTPFDFDAWAEARGDRG